jgi:creatinine amidohydrolase
MIYKMEEMTPDVFLEAIEHKPVFFVPTGLMEWHGDHLPLGLDALKAYSICLSTAKKIGGGVVLPPNYYGRPGFSGYTGTMTYSEACVDLLFTELFGQLKKLGAKVIVLLTGHYGGCQMDFIKRVSSYYTRENPDIKIIAQAEYEGIEIDGKVPSDHAGKWETSMFWYLYPYLTHMDKYKMTTNKKKLYDNPPNDFYKEKEEWIWSEDLSKSASMALGERAIEAICSRLASEIQGLLV